MNRTEALKQIVTFGENRELSYSTLAQFPFDSDIELLAVTRFDLTNALNKYLTNEISADDLEQWANFVESKDDLNYHEIEEYIYALANPVLFGKIDFLKINQMIQILNNSN